MIGPYCWLGCFDDRGYVHMVQPWIPFLTIRPTTGSAVTALAQPTPPGDGPYGFYFVISDAIVVTEKVRIVSILTEDLST